jgi:hypothetical protein
MQTLMIMAGAANLEAGRGNLGHFEDWHESCLVTFMCYTLSSRHTVDSPWGAEP